MELTKINNNSLMIPQKSGIYSITHVPTGLEYIGSSTRIQSRIKGHKNDLKNNRHHSQRLQNYWNKYSESEFIFSVVELVELPERLIEREQSHIDFRKPAFNMSPTAGSCLGSRHTEESKKRASISTKSRHPDWKIKVSKALQGHPVSEETRRKISVGHIGQKVSEATKAKISTARKGHFVSQDTRMKISKGRKKWVKAHQQ
jgi:group I intron endonuclease